MTRSSWAARSRRAAEAATTKTRTTRPHAMKTYLASREKTGLEETRLPPAMTRQEGKEEGEREEVVIAGGNPVVGVVVVINSVVVGSAVVINSDVVAAAVIVVFNDGSVLSVSSGWVDGGRPNGAMSEAIVSRV